MTDAWPKVRLRNFTLKNCFFGATNIVKNIDKEKYVYSGYGIAFDGKIEWSFGNYYTRNVMILGVDHLLIMIIFLMLSEGDTFGINGSFSAPETKV